MQKTSEGRNIKLYYHKVVEAKLVLSEQVIISLGTEFIENEAEDVEKQDCEINASKRLLARIKKGIPGCRSVYRQMRSMQQSR